MAAVTHRKSHFSFFFCYSELNIGRTFLAEICSENHNLPVQCSPFGAGIIFLILARSVYKM